MTMFKSHFYATLLLFDGISNLLLSKKPCMGTKPQRKEQKKKKVLEKWVHRG